MWCIVTCGASDFNQSRPNNPTEYTMSLPTGYRKLLGTSPDPNNVMIIAVNSEGGLLFTVICGSEDESTRWSKW